MKGALAFLLLGPALTWLAFFLIPSYPPRFIGPLPWVFFETTLLCLMALVFTPLVWMIAWAIDGYLTDTLPLSRRAPLMAILGATIVLVVLHIVVGMASTAWRLLPPSISAPPAIWEATAMGLCSLLSHDYGRKKRKSTES